MGAGLDPSGTLFRCFTQLCWISVAAGQPEGYAEGAQFLNIYLIAHTVDRLACSIQLQLAAGGALWPPAVGLSITNPFTVPLARRSIVVARVLEDTIARKAGTAQHG